MREPDVKSWADYYDTGLSEASVRSVFLPAENYRISRYHYPERTTTHGSMIDGVCFVLAGQCRFKFGQSIELQAGQFAELPSGSYELVAVGPGDLELVFVWELPTENKRTGRAG